MFCATPNALCHSLTQTHPIFRYIKLSLQAPSLIMDQSNPLANLILSTFDVEKNCTAAGAFAAHILQFWDDEDSFPLLSLRELVTFCSNTTIANITDGNLVDWYGFTDATAADSLKDFVAGMSNACQPDFCRNLEWEGNPDLAGIGVSFTLAQSAQRF